MEAVLALCPFPYYPSVTPTGLYIHIPFCHVRCGYCDFATYVGQEGQADDYISALETEMKGYEKQPIHTLFVGGGTPSVLTPPQIQRLFHALHQHFDFSNCQEQSVEMNPESVSAEGMAAFCENGINRVSLGLQSANNAQLEELGRLHNFETFLKAYETVRSKGIANVNIDLMYGLPGQSMQSWMQTLETVLNLNPEHISTYALKIETGTPFANQGIEVNDDVQADMYLQTSEYLQKNGFAHYEISNFARPGYACQHNLIYWTHGRFLGLGLSSASHDNGRRWQNVRGFKEYIQAQQERRSAVMDETILSPSEKKKEAIMLQLRLKEGVPQEEIKNIDVGMLDSFLKRGLARIEKGRYLLNPQGWLVSNQLFKEFV